MALRVLVGCKRVIDYAVRVSNHLTKLVTYTEENKINK